MNTNTNTNTEPAIKAYKLTLTTKATMPNASAEVSSVYLADGKLPTDYVDYGSYEQYDTDGCVYLYTDNNTEVCTDLYTAADRLAGGETWPEAAIRELKAMLTKGGEWAEKDVEYRANRPVLRVEALAEYPHLSAANTRANSDINTRAMMEVAVCGEPLVKDMTVCGRDIVLCRDVYSVITELVETNLNAKVGLYGRVEVTDVYSNSDADEYMSKGIITIRLTSPNMEALSSAYKALGITGGENITPVCTMGEGDAVTSVSVRLTIREND